MDHKYMFFAIHFMHKKEHQSCKNMQLIERKKTSKNEFSTVYMHVDIRQVMETLKTLKKIPQ